MEKYTSVKTVKLVLDITGECEIIYAGYSMAMFNPEKRFFGKVKGEYSEGNIVEFEFPDNDEQILGFEIHSFGSCILNKAWYETEVRDSDINPVELSIATTTCKKEAFIKNKPQSQILWDRAFLT